MACAVEKADNSRTAAFYLAHARALRPYGQFTDSIEKPPCSCEVSRAQRIVNPMTAASDCGPYPRTIQSNRAWSTHPRGGIVGAAMRTLVALWLPAGTNFGDPFGGPRRVHGWLSYARTRAVRRSAAPGEAPGSNHMPTRGMG
jgi:hypothetical protein